MNRPTRTHPMITHALGTVKCNPRFHAQSSHISPFPKSLVVALSDSNWRDMYDESNVIIRNSTWILVSKSPSANVVRSMWLFWHKYHADGSLSRYKARLIANGCRHQYDSLYGLKQAPVLGFNGLQALPTYLLQHIISSLHKEFDMTDMGALNYFLGILVTRESTCLFLSQKKYAMELLDRAHTASCNHTHTPVDMESKLVLTRILYLILSYIAVLQRSGNTLSLDQVSRLSIEVLLM
nr:ribonuclease H-like domain-containing protein [Tanacetum cinerariifolium]